MYCNGQVFYGSDVNLGFLVFELLIPYRRDNMGGWRICIAKNSSGVIAGLEKWLYNSNIFFFRMTKLIFDVEMFFDSSKSS